MKKSSITDIIKQFPKDIQDLLKDHVWTKDQEGMTEASVYLSAHHVIKIMPHDQESLNELWNYEHLSHVSFLAPLYAKIISQQSITILIKRWKGHMLSSLSPQDQIDILMDVLKALWSIPISDQMLDQTLNVRLKQAEDHVAHGCVDMATWDMDIQKSRFSSPQDLLNYLKANKPNEDLVFSHGDLTFENIIFDHQKGVGLIDIGRMGFADRYQDLALAYRSLLYQTNQDESTRLLFNQLQFDVDENKLDYYLLLDELF